LPWTSTLLSIRQRVTELLEVEFNSALLNLYRSGRDSIGFHSDDERELGPEPIIASVSYGSARTLIFRHRMARYDDVHVELADRSLLVMMGSTQSNWKHGIERCEAGPRINITFRQIK
jgi:alkylated DNA repair dioxygenase AlkB